MNWLAFILQLEPDVLKLVATILAAVHAAPAEHQQAVAAAAAKVQPGPAPTL